MAANVLASKLYGNHKPTKDLPSTVLKRSMSTALARFCHALPRDDQAERYRCG